MQATAECAAIECGDPAAMDAAIAALPNAPAVFALWPRAGEPYLSRTALLRRRLLRLLGEREKPSRLLNLRATAVRIEYWLTGSALESSLTLYEQARRLFPQSYLDLLKLRMPAYVKITLANPFPRTQITTQLARSEALYFGPFRSRASAERFEGQFLDLFQMRRCQEDLIPSPDHPGCIYGEMSMCLRPCQKAVGPEEYAQETARAAEFLRTGGRSLLDAISRSRDRLSEEMNFEEAARQHKRYEKVQEALKSRDELAADADRLNGVAITRAQVGQAVSPARVPALGHLRMAGETACPTNHAPNAVDLWFVRSGIWQGGQRFAFEAPEGKMISLDARLRDAFAAVEPRKLTARERQEYLALLSRWYYSSWCDGEWLSFDSFADIPYRKLVHAINRVARAGQ